MSYWDARDSTRDKNEQITTIDSDPARLFLMQSVMAQNIRCMVSSRNLIFKCCQNSITREEYIYFDSDPIRVFLLQSNIHIHSFNPRMLFGMNRDNLD